MGENSTIFREESILVCTILNEKSLLQNICMHVVSLSKASVLWYN